MTATNARKAMQTSDNLRRAVAALTDRERAAMAQQSTQVARKWGGTFPSIAAVWDAFAALVAEVDRHERARTAPDPPQAVDR